MWWRRNSDLRVGARSLVAERDLSRSGHLVGDLKTVTSRGPRNCHVVGGMKGAQWARGEDYPVLALSEGGHPQVCLQTFLLSCVLATWQAPVHCHCRVLAPSLSSDSPGAASYQMNACSPWSASCPILLSLPVLPVPFLSHLGKSSNCNIRRDPSDVFSCKF